MISIASSTRIFVATSPTDMRKGFDGLQGLVAGVLGQDPLSGHLFLFVNRRRDKLKVLYWDGDGLAIWYRRLEQGTFQMPSITGDRTAAEINREDLLSRNFLPCKFIWDYSQVECHRPFFQVFQCSLSIFLFVVVVTYVNVFLTILEHPVDNFRQLVGCRCNRFG